jgi:hypothetical protein
MCRLTTVGILLLALAPDIHARLCVKSNGTLASRDTCKRREREFPIASLLPAPRATLVTLRNSPVALRPQAQGGTRVAALALPSGESQNTGNYAIFSTVPLANRRAVADAASCVLAATTSTSMTLLGELPDVSPSTLQNGSGTVALWCSAGAPESDFPADTASLLAIPVEQLQTQ